MMHFARIAFRDAEDAFRDAKDERDGMLMLRRGRAQGFKCDDALARGNVTQ